ncbi:MAG: hypothetical protein HOK58_00345 [Acidimicrobiaceae bacterium]|nr:hypothetical protein [Acidimicrobiaceae bacterium]
MLNKFDDFPIHQTPEPIAHPATSDPNFYDRTWFNGYRRDASQYFALGLAVYPHRGILDCAFSTVEAGGRQHCFFASGRAPQERTDTSMGPFRLEIVEPLRKARVIIEDNETGISADVTFSARTSPIQEARQILWQDQRRFMDATRFAQFGTWSGTVVHPDGEFEVNETEWLGTKDRSWGVRGVGERIQIGAPKRPGAFFFLWAPLIWDDHVSHAVFFDGSRGEALVREGSTSPLYATADEIPSELDKTADHMATAVHRVRYHPGTRLASSCELDLIDLYGSVRTIEMTPQLRFQMKGLGYGHPIWKQGAWQGELAIHGESYDHDTMDLTAPENIHVQQVVTVTDGTRSGIGVLEQIVVGPYEPSGLTGLFDGAPAS